MQDLKFEIIDLVSRETLDVIKGTKNDADIRFTELKEKYPKRKLWLKLATKSKIKK